jgi:hypothetical protein
MPMPARTVLPAKLAAAEKHMGRRFLRCGKYMKFWGRRSVFFCFGRLVRCRVGCWFWGGAVKNGAQAGMPVLLKPVATIPFCGLIFFRVADRLLLEGVL